MNIYLEVKQDKISDDKMVDKIFASNNQNTQKRMFLCFKDDKKFKNIDGKDIAGFTFGGVSSRFWVMKNFINLLPANKNLPDSCLCWNMITIYLKQNEKQINLIIHDQMQMDTLILLLLQIQYENNFVEAIQGACAIKDIDDKEEALRTLSRRLKKNKNLDFHQALKVYKIMRIRMKISYHAWKKKLTVSQLLYSQIFKTFNEIRRNEQSFKVLDIDDVLDSSFNLRNIALNFSNFAKLAKEHKGDVKSHDVDRKIG